MSKFLYLGYPSDEERSLPINDWLMLQNFQNLTGQYPCDFWFSPGYEPSHDLMIFLSNMCHQGGRG